MEPGIGKPSFFRNLLVRLLLFSVIIIALRFAYVVIIHGELCDSGDFCFFSLPNNLDAVKAISESSSSAVIPVKDSALENHNKNPDGFDNKDFKKGSKFYYSIFQDLISEGFLRPNSKALCVETEGYDVFSLKEIGVRDSIGIAKKSVEPLVVSGEAIKMDFDDESFHFVFSGGWMVEKSKSPVDFSSEICRILKPEGYLVIHSSSATDTYSFNSLIDLFDCCTLVKSTEIENGIGKSDMKMIRQVVMRKQLLGHKVERIDGDSMNKCSVPGYKQELIQKAEPLITEEPKKPWITLKRNLQNIKYLSSVVDISFKARYVYVDVGSRSYGSSIVSWFKKQYPKQNKTFDIYAIEADKHFHDQYKYKKGVTLLPYAAWVRNESLFFEINQDPRDKSEVKGRGMGRIQPVQSSIGSKPSHVNEIHGFDFAEWLKSAVSKKDFVVMKMDIEGTEFDLIPRLIETGAICLIDEIFLECHYNRWQKCCPGVRSPKYEKTYGQCLDLFTSLRDNGVLVHQWF